MTGNQNTISITVRLIARITLADGSSKPGICFARSTLIRRIYTPSTIVVTRLAVSIRSHEMAFRTNALEVTVQKGFVRFTRLTFIGVRTRTSGTRWVAGQLNTLSRRIENVSVVASTSSILNKSILFARLTISRAS